jgi:hypothetical protein
LKVKKTKLASEEPLFRAYYHLVVGNSFGGIPLLKKGMCTPKVGDEKTIARSTVKRSLCIN